MNKIKSAALLGAIVLMAFGCNTKLTPEATTMRTLRVGPAVVRVEVADTDETRKRGLSGRGELAMDSGMWFVFTEPAQHQFWMKDMKFPLDFIWVRGGQVVEITENVAIEAGVEDKNLKVYKPSIDVDSMLEVNAGWASRNGVKVGDPVVNLNPGTRP